MSVVKLTVAACVLTLATACAPGGAAPQASPTLPPQWSTHNAAGLRIAAPSAWVGPEVLPATAATGPRAWVVFRDTSGAEAVTLMTWRDATAATLASEQFQSERPQGAAPQQLTLVEGAETRTVVAMTGYAQWSDARGAGTYECRYLFVQVDPRLVVNVIACGAHVQGTSTPTPELRHLQEQVALRLAVAEGTR